MRTPLVLRQSEHLLDNHIKCHCGAQSRHSRSWQVVQDWWKKHGYGKAC